jgi:periplasmic divalent cation tolerance protein
MTEILMLYIPCPDQKSASNILETLIYEKLVACGNYTNVTSMYNWDENLCKEGEIILFMKSLPEKGERLENRILELHPYDAPCVARWHVTVNNTYYKWVSGELES